MLSRIREYLLDIRDLQRLNICLSRGLAGRASRRIDLTRPDTWEFSGFSQNGEDGILDVLRSNLSDQNRHFIEIGSADGLQNNTTWLALTEGFSGLMIDGDPALLRRARRLLSVYRIDLEFLSLFVASDCGATIREAARVGDPDILSLDIDGNDYYVAKALLDSGLRPKIFVVEYNSVYGAEQSITVAYDASFTFKSAHPSALYYGVSIAAWKKFFSGRGYRFVTVDRNGVNAFFVDSSSFGDEFLGRISGLEFAENRYQLLKFGAPSQEQFRLIADQKFVAV